MTLSCAFPFLFLGQQTIILVLPLLALITQQTQVNNEIVVSYIVAMHLWFVVCTLFIVMALIELAVALIYVQKVADWKEDHEACERQLLSTAIGTETSKPASAPSQTLHPPPSPGAESDTELNERKYSQSMRRSSYAYSKRGSIFTLSGEKDNSGKNTARLIKTLLNHIYGPIDWRKSPQDRNKIDYVARILFPSSFLIFVIFYFTTLNT